jgi:superfamily II DNA or RNA helicase
MHPLRDYQARAVGLVQKHHTAGTRRVLLVSPTGSGKSVMGVASALPYEHVLWLAHRKELVQDAARRLREEVGGLDVGIIAAGMPPSPYARFQVSSVQTMTRRPQQRPPAGLVVFDEAHHAAAEDWRAVPDHYTKANHLLLTATPERQDGKPMSDMADVIEVAAEYSELLEAGHLCPARVFAAAQITGNNLANDPVESWERLSEGSPGFAFFSTVDQCYQTEHRMNERGIRAAVIEQGTEPAKRAGYIEAMRAGELDCILNVYTMTEGVDVPRARVCMLASACRSAGGYLQKVGRVLRPHESKTSAIIIDLVGATVLHGFPTDNRTYSLDGEAIRQTNEVPLKRCLVCGAMVHAQYVTCPECNTPFVLEPKKRQGPRIYSMDLVEVYQGKDTAEEHKRAEYDRLRKIQRTNKYPLYWLQKQYKELFLENVIIRDATNDEKRAEFAKFKQIGLKRGSNPNFAKVMFKNTFGHWPSG